MSFNRAEFSWNSVDVRGDDGLLHNGRVVDAVEEGLLVEFGGTGHSDRKLIPFGGVYYSEYSNFMHRSDHSGHAIDGEVGLGAEPAEVQVLLRLQPSDPWKWYPGRLLQSFGLVRVTVPEREMGGVAVAFRIREKLEDEDEEDLVRHFAVKAGKFLKKLVTVPSEHGVILPADDHLIAIFNAHCRQHGYWMMATQVISNAEHGKELAVLGIFEYDSDAGDMPEDFCNTRKECTQNLDQVLLSLLKDASGRLERGLCLSSATLSLEGDIQSLQRDPTIFPVIFQCLTTIQQTRIRGVCRQWNATLTSAYIRGVITASAPRRVAYKEHVYLHNVPLYEFAACLYNCWTQKTRMLVVCGPDTRCGRLTETAQLLQRVMAEKGLPPVPVLVVDGLWRLSVDVLNWVNNLCIVCLSLGSVCQQVVLNPDVFLTCSTRPYSLIMIVSFVVKRMSSPLTANKFWMELNNGLIDFNAIVGIEMMELLAKWITPGSKFFDPIIPQILNVTQTQDPRDGVRYRGMSFSLAEDGGLKGVDVEHLTNLTLHTLFQYYTQVVYTAASTRQASEPPRKKKKLFQMKTKELFIC